MEREYKTTIKKLAIIILFFSCCLSLTGCTVKIANAVNKALTFRDWEMYQSDIKYWKFDEGKRKVGDYSSDTYRLMIADDNSYIRYTIDYGSDEYLSSVRIKSFDSDLKPYIDFFRWASKDLDERNKTSTELNSSVTFKRYNFSVVNERATNEPLLLITRDPGFYLKVHYYAMTRLEVSKLILSAYEMKQDNSRGVKNQTDYDRVSL